MALILIQLDPVTRVQRDVTATERTEWAKDFTIFDVNPDGTTGAAVGPTRVRQREGKLWIDAMGLMRRGAEGAVVTAAADTTAPTLAGSITATEVTAGSALLSWPGAGDDFLVAGYRLSTDGGTTYTALPNVTRHWLTGLLASTTYALRVQAFDLAGNASAAISGSVTTAAAPGGGGGGQAPDVVGPMLSGTVTASNITASSATLTWPAATDNVAVTEYRYSTNGGVTYTSAGPVLTANVTGLTASTTYQLRVQALDAAGNVSAAISGTLTTSAPVADTRPRYGIGPSTHWNTAPATALAGMSPAPGSSNGGKAGGPFTVTTTAGNYGWFATTAAGGVTFTDQGTMLQGGWQLIGNNQVSGATWYWWRQDYPNASPAGTTFTAS